jgi:hypothetical protein
VYRARRLRLLRRQIDFQTGEYPDPVAAQSHAAGNVDAPALAGQTDGTAADERWMIQ